MKTYKIGERIGLWTIKKVGLYIDSRRAVVAVCKCGTKSKIRETTLRTGQSLKCHGHLKHGHTQYGEYSLTYSSWHNMWIRAGGKSKRKTYVKYYTSRGIGVCKRWKKFKNFLSDMGERPSESHSIERILNHKSYSPSNCRWATPAEQCRNTRRNRLITYNSKTLCAIDWSKITGIPVTAQSVHRDARALQAAHASSGAMGARLLRTALRRADLRESLVGGEGPYGTTGRNAGEFEERKFAAQTAEEGCNGMSSTVLELARLIRDLIKDVIDLRERVEALENEREEELDKTEHDRNARELERLGDRCRCIERCGG